jgi:hypothetical protein
MDSAVAGLVGVAVGGVISTGWSWAAVVRQELSEALVALRLVSDDLVSYDARDENAGLDARTWTTNRAALARVLGHRQWQAVAAAYRKPSRSDVDLALEQLQGMAKGKRFIVVQRVHDFFVGPGEPRR